MRQAIQSPFIIDRQASTMTSLPLTRIGTRVRALSTFTVIGSPACTVGLEKPEILSMFLKYSKNCACGVRRNLSIWRTLKEEGARA